MHLPIYLFIENILSFSGWHQRLNRLAGRKSLLVYALVTVLHTEAHTVPDTRVLVAFGKSNLRLCRKETREFNARLAEIWLIYDKKEKTPRQTLSAIARLLMKK